MVRFIHISDCHIGPDPAFVTCGHNPYRELRELVGVINALPFPFDFVLHTGDVVDQACTANYELAGSVLTQLKAPVYYLPGNHDCAVLMQSTLLQKSNALERYDQSFNIGGVQFLLLDSRGVNTAGGELLPSQLERLEAFCEAGDGPLVIGMHHPPISLDVPWLDDDPAMSLSNRESCLRAMKSAGQRLRGIFFGHVHRAFQVVQDGLFFSSAPSIFGQLKTWPGLAAPVLAKEEAPGYCVATVDERRTIVQQYSFPRAMSVSVTAEPHHPAS